MRWWSMQRTRSVAFDAVVQEHFCLQRIGQHERDPGDFEP
jgi:hypothetical protein